MKISAGFTLAYECHQPTPMLLVLDVHPSRRGDLLTDQTLVFDQPVDPQTYSDVFGNICTRIVAPPGVTTISTAFEIRDSGRPDAIVPDAVQHDVADLPHETLVYLLGSRYCDTQHLASVAWSLFGNTQPGWARVQAICDFAHERLTFDYQRADATRTAFGGYNDRTGVCRDFAHLAITLCRCMNIPARYCTGYLGDIGVVAVPGPMDFSAWFEAYLGGRWYAFDARHNIPRIGRTIMGIGRDATDVALSTSFGPSYLTHFNVVTDDLPD